MKKAPETQTKGKGADLAKWDAEIRKSLAGKKNVAAPILSKQDAALVKAQVEKESQIRRRVTGIKTRLERGLQVISHLVSGNIDRLHEHVSDLAGLLLYGGSLGKGSTLVGRSSFDTYLVRVVDFQWLSEEFNGRL